MAVENKSLSGIPKWGGKQEMTAMYILKLEVLVEFHNIRDALDVMAMVNCPMKSEYDALDLSNKCESKKAIIY